MKRYGGGEDQLNFYVAKKRNQNNHRIRERIQVRRKEQKLEERKIPDKIQKLFDSKSSKFAKKDGRQFAKMNLRTKDRLKFECKNRFGDDFKDNLTIYYCFVPNRDMSIEYSVMKVIPTLNGLPLTIPSNGIR